MTNQQTTKGIKLGTVIRANEDMKGGSGKEINGVRYYTFNQAIETAKQQGLTLPTKQDFIDSGFSTKRSKENKKLADKLGFTLYGDCSSDGRLNYEGRYGYRWSASPEDSYDARGFKFDKDIGILLRYNRDYALQVRPVFKNSTSDNSSIGQFSTDELKAQLNQAQNNAEIWTAIWAIYDYHLAQSVQNKISKNPSDDSLEQIKLIKDKIQNLINIYTKLDEAQQMVEAGEVLEQLKFLI